MYTLLDTSNSSPIKTKIVKKLAPINVKILKNRIKTNLTIINRNTNKE